MTDSSSQRAAVDARPQASPVTTLMQSDLCVLTAHLLLHILEIDRRHARQRTHSADTQPTRNEHE
jgi:hypothetical protein